MEISFKIFSYEDRDNMILALVRAGYVVSSKWVEKSYYDEPKEHWLVTVHNYE